MSQCTTARMCNAHNTYNKHTHTQAKHLQKEKNLNDLFIRW